MIFGGRYGDPMDDHGDVALPDRPGLGDDLRFDYIDDNVVAW
jgi:hypothetical protein